MITKQKVFTIRSNSLVIDWGLIAECIPTLHHRLSSEVRSAEEWNLSRMWEMLWTHLGSRLHHQPLSPPLFVSVSFHPSVSFLVSVIVLLFALLVTSEFVYVPYYNQLNINVSIFSRRSFAREWLHRGRRLSSSWLSVLWSVGRRWRHGRMIQMTSSFTGGRHSMAPLAKKCPRKVDWMELTTSEPSKWRGWGRVGGGGGE